jgi:hypothetical protein
MSAKEAGAATVVVGAYQGDVTAGLPRVADLTGVSVVQDGHTLTVNLP